MEFTQLNNAPDNLIDRIGISHQDHSESSFSDHGDFGIWPSSAPPEPKDICAELCREYTRLITEYWRVCRVNSELDSKHYLDIIDLCPGSGLSCWLMMKSLGRHIGTEFRYRYIPLVPDRSWLSDLLTIPEFSDWIQNGSLAPLVWDCSQADPRFFGNADEKIWRPCNPLVVLSHDRFCYLRHRLLAVHYGRLFEAQFVDSTDEYHFVSEQPEKYDTKKQNESVKWNHLDRTQEEIGLGIKFNKYLEKFNSSPLPLPLGAVQFIKKIHQLAHRGYLLVSLGNGMNTEQDLRLASFQYLIEKVQKKYTMDVVHVHYAVPHATAALLARRIMRQNGTPMPKLITTLHGTDITLLARDKSLLNIIKYSIERSHGVTAVSNSLRLETIKVLKTEKPIEVIYDFFTPPPITKTRAQVRKELKLKDTDFVAIHLSNLRPVKRIPDLLNTIARAKSNPNLKLLILSGGDFSPYEPLVKKLGLQNKLIIKQGVTDIGNYLNAADIGIYPSETESFGMGILEAMAYGKPVLASRSGGVPEVVENGKTGFLLKVGDVAGFTKKLKLLMQNSQLREQMGIAAKLVACEKFCSKIIVPQYLEYYKKILEQK